MFYIKQRVRVHSYGHTDRQMDRRTDTGCDIVASAVKQIATKIDLSLTLILSSLEKHSESGLSASTGDLAAILPAM